MVSVRGLFLGGSGVLIGVKPRSFFSDALCTDSLNKAYMLKAELSALDSSLGHHS